MRRLVWVLALVGLLAPGPVGRGAEPDRAPGRAAALVARLGDPSYEAREEAGRLLVELGWAAEAAVVRGLGDEDAEVRRRCGELLPVVRQSPEEARLAAFAAGQGDGAGMVGWAGFRELAGRDLAARRLYAELWRADRPLLEALARNPRAVGEQLPRRRAHLIGRFIFGNSVRPDGRDVTTAEVAGFLLSAVAARRCGLLGAKEFHEMWTVLQHEAVEAQVKETSGVARLYEELLGSFVRHATAWEQVAHLARRMELEDLVEQQVAPELFRRVVEAKANPGDTARIRAVVAMARILDLREAVVAELRPAVQRQVVVSLENNQEVGRIDRLEEAVTLTDALGLDDLQEGLVKPVVRQFLATMSRSGDGDLLWRHGRWPEQSI